MTEITEDTHQSFSVTSDEHGVVDLTPSPLFNTTKAVVETPTQETQEKILGKFANQAELEKAYQELEKKQSNVNNKTNESPTTAEPAEGDGVKLPSDEDEVVDETTTVDEEVVDEVPEPISEVKGSVDAAFVALHEAGEMTPEILNQFESVGISKELVDQFTELVKFKAETEFASQLALVGGQENYSALLDWAKTNLSDTEVKMFDKVIDNGSAAEVSVAITNLNDKMKAKTNYKPASKLVKADGVAKARSVYVDEASYHKDMFDARYATDAKYRAAVDEKLSRSTFNKR